jgi:hypothetical protein
MGLIKIAAYNKKPLSDDAVLARSQMHYMRGKDPDDFIALLNSNKHAKKAQGRYKSMIQKIKKEKARKMVKRIGVGSIITGIAAYAAKKYKDHKNESH